MSFFFAEKQYIFHLDSHDRLDKNDPHGDATYKIEIEGGIMLDYDHVVLLSCAIPKSYYAIKSPFNNYTLDEDGFTVSITFLDGTYSANQIKDRILSELNTKSPNGATYTIDFDSATAKFTFNVTNDGGALTFKFIFDENSDLHETLGFSRGSTNTFTGFPQLLTSTTIIDVSPENDIFIRSDLCSTLDGNSDILQDLQASGIAPYGRIQFYQSNLNGYGRLLNNKGNIYRITITNEDETLGRKTIDLNGKNWVCALLFYKASRLPEMLQNYIKLQTLKDSEL